MRTTHGSTGLALAVALSVGFTACDRRSSPLDPVGGESAAVRTSKAPIDIGGMWTWEETGKLNMTEAAAAGIFGVVPEGPRTHATCHASGTLTLNQSGDTFTGSATQASSCETNGGQQFSPAAFPPVLPVLNGSIRGRHIEFDFGGPPVPCPYTASARVVNGIAVALRGTGRCIVPGHPRSPTPVPPPPVAPTKTIDWTATR